MVENDIKQLIDTDTGSVRAEPPTSAESPVQAENSAPGASSPSQDESMQRNIPLQLAAGQQELIERLRDQTVKQAADLSLSSLHIKELKRSKDQLVAENALLREKVESSSYCIASIDFFSCSHGVLQSLVYYTLYFGCCSVLGLCAL